MPLRFGTDGVRGEAHSVLSDDYVRALGAAAARTIPSNTFLVGRDTRESGPTLQHAFAEGCASEDVTIVDLGVVPTPAVAWLSRADGVAAAMVSASHNPWYDNGVKLFGVGGKKLAEAEQDAIQALLDGGIAPGKTQPHVESASIDRYVDSVVNSVDGRTLDGTRVVVDCAHGSATTTAREIFARLGADVRAIAVQPDGRNINDGVGSTHPECLVAAVLEQGASAGFAFDGDADRVIGVGADGSLIDGDRILAMTAIDRHDRGALPSNTVVITVMTNLGFRVAMAERGIELIETPVGDRHVLEALDAGGYTLGGEQSGHIIHRDLATTGDGVLTAVQLMDAAVRRGVDVGSWAKEVMTSYPQVLENVRVDHRIDDLERRLATAVASEEEHLGETGRVLIRASGTEPLIRVMVEASEPAEAIASAGRLVEHVQLMAQPLSAD